MSRLINVCNVLEQYNSYQGKAMLYLPIDHNVLVEIGARVRIMTDVRYRNINTMSSYEVLKEIRQ